jgi:hypothetical protein
MNRYKFLPLYLMFSLWVALPVQAWANEIPVPPGWVKIIPGTTKTSYGRLGPTLQDILSENGCQWLALPAKRFTDPYTPLISVNYVPIPAGKVITLDEKHLNDLSHAFEQGAAEKGTYQFIEKRLFTFKGTQVCRIILDLQQRGVKAPMRFLEFAFQNGKNLAFVTCACMKSDFSTYGSIFQGMIAGALGP